MKHYIQITAGRGPVECARAVTLVAREIVKAIPSLQLADCEPHNQVEGCYMSMTFVTSESILETIVREWQGTVLWHSTANHYRPGHKRSNWSVYEKYGTPIYIKDVEVLQLADFDFSHNKHLDTQRDIFIFQCCIGCRVGDMMKMTPANVINGGVEYIASKTADERPETIRVPLSDRAQFIIDKHREEVKDGRLLPFISQQKYNEAIKEIFEAAGITRLVTRLNLTTGVEEQVPINTIATSHMARRTFVGNLYKKVKDQNLVGALSGHSVGSKAFARYREIDEDMKRELVNVMGY